MIGCAGDVSFLVPPTWCKQLTNRQSSNAMNVAFDGCHAVIMLHLPLQTLLSMETNAHAQVASYPN